MGDPEFEAFAAEVRSRLIPMIGESAMTVSICPPDEDQVDVKFAIELGVSIMLGKPIIVAVPPGRSVPEGLVRIADEIVELTAMDSETSGRLMEAIQRVSDRLDGQGDR